MPKAEATQVESVCIRCSDNGFAEPHLPLLQQGASILVVEIAKYRGNTHNRAALPLRILTSERLRAERAIY
ncbi:MAG: hypothetical protein C4293_03460 [Nitrospiraceae bacterium]